MPRSTEIPTGLHEVFCRNLKLVRAQRGFTQQEMANAMDVSRPYVADIERGRFQPTLSLVERCAIALRVPPRVLVDDRAPRNILKFRLTR
jgi:transcriptional regulator with XRE-family HTH domain